MFCSFCGENPEHLVILPIKQPGGFLCSFACLECAKESGAFCLKHEVPHLGFEGDDTTACQFCIMEEVDRNVKRAGQFVRKLREVLPADEFYELAEEARFTARVYPFRPSVAVLYFLATKAARLKVPLESVVELLKTTRSAENLFI